MTSAPLPPPKPVPTTPTSRESPRSSLPGWLERGWWRVWMVCQHDRDGGGLSHHCLGQGAMWLADEKRRVSCGRDTAAPSGSSSSSSRLLSLDDGTWSAGEGGGEVEVWRRGRQPSDGKISAPVPQRALLQTEQAKKRRVTLTSMGMVAGCRRCRRHLAAALTSSPPTPQSSNWSPISGGGLEGQCQHHCGARSGSLLILPRIRAES